MRVALLFVSLLVGFSYSVRANADVEFRAECSASGVPQDDWSDGHADVEAHFILNQADMSAAGEILHLTFLDHEKNGTNYQGLLDENPTVQVSQSPERVSFLTIFDSQRSELSSLTVSFFNGDRGEFFEALRALAHEPVFISAQVILSNVQGKVAVRSDVLCRVLRYMEI